MVHLDPMPRSNTTPGGHGQSPPSRRKRGRERSVDLLTHVSELVSALTISDARASAQRTEEACRNSPPVKDRNTDEKLKRATTIELPPTKLEHIRRVRLVLPDLKSSYVILNAFDILNHASNHNIHVQANAEQIALVHKTLANLNRAGRHVCIMNVVLRPGIGYEATLSSGVIGDKTNVIFKQVFSTVEVAHAFMDHFRYNLEYSLYLTMLDTSCTNNLPKRQGPRETSTAADHSNAAAAAAKNKAALLSTASGGLKLLPTSCHVKAAYGDLSLHQQRAVLRRQTFAYQRIAQQFQSTVALKQARVAKQQQRVAAAAHKAVTGECIPESPLPQRDYLPLDWIVDEFEEILKREGYMK